MSDQQTTNEKTEIVINFLGDMQTINVSHTDVIVIQSEQHLDKDTAENLSECIKKTFPLNKCIVLGGGLKFSVASTDIAFDQIGYPPIVSTGRG